jgi:cytochrome c-type biogenesis protein CcsB
MFLILTQGKQIGLKGSSIGDIQFQTFKSSENSMATELSLNYDYQDGILEKKLNLLESLDNLSYRIIGLGFPLLTIGIIAGAVWANEAWGSYWSWDPKETWALITWLVFAAYLHARITKSWQGKGPAILASIGFIVVWICYLGVNFLGKGLHSYGWII